MEAWCFDSVEKGYVSNETVSPCDSITKTKNVLMGWEFKDPFNCESSLLIPSQQNVGNSGYPEVGFEEVLRTQLPHDSGRNVFNMNASVGGIVSPSLVTCNAISGNDESSLKLSSSVVNCKNRESLLVDLKLSEFGNKTSLNTSRANPNSSSSESPTPSKRGRVNNLSSQTAYCQVYGCNKDLSSAKDYYKRHRVCEAHSKTTKVIVNGIEQRFCQQCSRFHLVAEFDNGKRSCRKRLAEHNERRRKPQVVFNGSRPERSPHSYAGFEGTWFHGSTLSSTLTSFICQETNGLSSIKKHRRNDWYTHMKINDGTNYVQKSDNTCINGGLPDQKPVLPSSLSREDYPSLKNNMNKSSLGSDFRKNIEKNPQKISSSMFQNEDLTLFDAASTAQDLPGISDSGCALSLLSSQSTLSNSPHYNVSEGSDKLCGFQSKCSIYGDTGSSDVRTQVLQASEFINLKDRLSHENESTVDLLQLSTQLHCVGNQSQPRHTWQEIEGFCCLVKCMACIRNKDINMNKTL